MKPIRKILVPVDFSTHSKEAIRVAAELASRYDASVTLAHVFELLSGIEATLAYSLPEGYVLFTPKQIDDFTREHEKLLAAAKMEAQAAGARNVETKQLQGVPWLTILELAKAGGFDLIVMGTHGRRGLGRAMLGSVAERVLREGALSSADGTRARASGGNEDVTGVEPAAASRSEREQRRPRGRNSSPSRRVTLATDGTQRSPHSNSWGKGGCRSCGCPRRPPRRRGQRTRAPRVPDAGGREDDRGIQLAGRPLLARMVSMSAGGL